MIRAFCVLLLTTALGGDVSAQTVSRDPLSGDHLISYEIDGEAYIAHIAGPDQISPRMVLTSVTRTGQNWRYDYLLANDEREPARVGRGIVLLSV